MQLSSGGKLMQVNDVCCCSLPKRDRRVTQALRGVLAETATAGIIR